jgi:hypothetical protein
LLVSLTAISLSLICIFEQNGQFGFCQTKKWTSAQQQRKTNCSERFQLFETSQLDKSVNWIVSETTEGTGVSKTSVFKISSESARGPLVTPNKKRQSKGVRRNSGEVKYDDFIRSSIRRKVHEFYFRS